MLRRSREQNKRRDNGVDIRFGVDDRRVRAGLQLEPVEDITVLQQLGAGEWALFCTVRGLGTLYPHSTKLLETVKAPHMW